MGTRRRFIRQGLLAGTALTLSGRGLTRPPYDDARSAGGGAQRRTLLRRLEQCGRWPRHRHLAHAGAGGRPGCPSRSRRRRHSDLFWGIRGGGGTFGIATSFTFGLHPVGPVLAGLLTWPLTQAPAVLRVFREIVSDCPDGFQPTVALFADATPWFGVFVFWAGDQHQGEALIRPLRHVAAPLQDTVRPMKYVETHAEYMGPDYDAQRAGRGRGRGHGTLDR